MAKEDALGFPVEEEEEDGRATTAPRRLISDARLYAANQIMRLLDDLEADDKRAVIQILNILTLNAPATE